MTSPRDFGSKTRNSQLGSLSPLSSPYSSKESPFSSLNSGFENSTLPRILSGNLSAGEMELLEEYTCVITHGPNPKTTHIFDDCIIENCCEIVGFSASLKKENGFGTEESLQYPSESFLSFCYNCNKNLGQGKDIYMYSSYQRENMNILYNTFGFYAQFLPIILVHMETSRKSIESELKEIMKLCRWDRTDSYLNMEIFKRTRKKLPR